MARDKTKPLSIPLFPQDFMGCAYVQGMTYEEIGCYIWLMMLSWQLDPPCTIPADKALQARLLRLPADQWLSLSTAVLMPWHDLGNGRLEQKRLRREWDYLVGKMEAGSKGGLAKSVANGKQTSSTSGSKPLAERKQTSSKVGSERLAPIPIPIPIPSVSESQIRTTTTTAREEPSLSGIELDPAQAAAADKIFAAATDAMRPKGNAANGWVLPLHEATRLSGIIDATMKAGTAFISGREWHPWELADEYAAAVRGSNPAGINGLVNFIDAVWKRCQRSGCKPGDPHKSNGLAIEKQKPKIKGAFAE